MNPEHHNMAMLSCLFDKHGKVEIKGAEIKQAFLGKVIVYVLSGCNLVFDESVRGKNIKKKDAVQKKTCTEYHYCQFPWLYS